MFKSIVAPLALVVLATGRIDRVTRSTRESGKIRRPHNSNRRDRPIHLPSAGSKQ
jgi:hypothetical protein